MRRRMSVTLACRRRRMPRSGTMLLHQRRNHHEGPGYAQRKVLMIGGPVVVWVRLPNTRRRDLLTWFETVLPEILAALARGEVLVEVT